MKSIAKKLTLPVLCLSLLPWMLVHAQVVLRAEVQKPLLAAQEALKNNRVEQALRHAAEAAAVSGMTPAEQQFVWRLQAAAAVRGQQWSLAVDRLEALLGLSDVSAADRLGFQEMLVNASIQKKDHALTVRVARQYLQAGGANLSVRTALLQALSLLGAHQALLQEMETFVRQDQAQHRKTPEVELRLMGVASLQLKDHKNYFSVLKRLLDHYPSKAYWADAIVRLTNLPGFDARYELDAYRLLAETDNLEESAEYAEMAGLSLKAGLPAEAVGILEQGLQKNILGKGSEATTHARLLNDARKKAQEDDALLPQLEQSAKDGSAWVAVAEAYAAKQNWMAAMAAYDKAFKLGGLRREEEAVLRRGVALFKAGQKPQALDQWKSLQAEGTSGQIASLWILLAR